MLSSCANVGKLTSWLGPTWGGQSTHRPLERMKIAAKLRDRIHKKLEQEQALNLARQAEQRRIALCNCLRKDIQQPTTKDVELKKDILASMLQIKVLNLRPFLPWMAAEDTMSDGFGEYFQANSTIMFFIFEGQPNFKFELSMHGKLNLYSARHGELDTQNVAPHSFAKPDWAPELKATTLDSNKSLFPAPRYVAQGSAEDEDKLNEEMILLEYIPDWPEEENDLLREETWAAQNWEGLFGLKSRTAFLGFFYLLCVDVMGTSQLLFDMLSKQSPFSSVIDKFLMGDLSSSSENAVSLVQQTNCTECGKQVNRAKDARCFCCLSLQAAFFCSQACEETGKEKHNNECPHGWLHDLPRGKEMEVVPPLVQAKFGYSDCMSSEFQCWCKHGTPKALHTQFTLGEFTDDEPENTF